MNVSARQSGSALIIILIAIALFAGLSWAVSQGSRSSAGALTQEQARLAAQEIIAYGNALAKTVQTLRLRGCGENQFDFANSVGVRTDATVIHAPGHNSNAPATGCSVFSAADGKMQASVFPQNYFANITLSSGQYQFGSSGILIMVMPGVGNSANGDLVLNLPHLSDAVCLKINDILGIANPGGTPPDHAAPSSYSTYTNTLSNSFPITDTDSVLTGRSAYCSKETSTNDNRFFQVILSR